MFFMILLIFATKKAFRSLDELSSSFFPKNFIIFLMQMLNRFIPSTTLYTELSR
jgi:hypothetical protein